jgi:hypothetical protein
VKRSLRGSLPRLLRSSGGRLDGVTAVGGSPAQMRPTVAILGCHPAEAKGKMEPLLPTGAHQPEGGDGDVVIQHNADGGRSLARWRGKVVIG